MAHSNFPETDPIDADSASPTPSERGPLLRVAFALLGVEIIGLVIGAVWLLIDRPDGAMSSWGYALTMGLVILSFAFLLAIGGRALWQGKRWGRGPVITWQILQIFTAMTVYDVIGMAWSWVGAIVGAVVMVGILAPTSLAVTSATAGASPTAGSVQK